MELNLIEIVLIVLVISLIVYIAYMKGQKSNKKNFEIKEGYSTLKVENLVNEVKQTEKRDPKNTKYLVEIKEIYSQFIEKFSNNFPDNIFYPFYKPYSELGNYLEEVRNENQLSIDQIEKVIKWVKVNSLKSEIEKEITNSSNFIVNSFIAVINSGLDSYPKAQTKRYHKNDDQLEATRQKIQNLIRKNLGSFYSELSEIQSSQSKCISLWRTTKEVLEESDVDIGSLAKSFGSGALIALNPFIGVPALIAHYFNEDSRYKKKEKLINEFFEYYDQYLESWDRTRTELDPISKEISTNIKKLLMSDSYKSLMNIMEDIDKAGYSLKDELKEFNELLQEQ